MRDLAYYIEQWTDETMPCDASLQGWANWLAGPDEDWGRPEPEVSGAMFKADKTTLTHLTILPNGAGRYGPPIECPPHDFCAIWQGSGWDVEDVHESLDGLIEAANDPEWGHEGDLDVVFGKSVGDVMVRFERTDEGPRCVDLGPAQ